MKSNKLKILGIVLAVAVLLFGGLFYYASTKLQPEEIKKIAIEQAKKTFPKADVTLQTVDIGWGLNFNINLQKFSIKTSKDDHVIDMMSVDELVVKVPIWAIITGSGIVEIKMDAPVMNYHEFAEGNNWTYAMGEKKSDEEKKKEESKNEGGANSALGIFGKSKINVKLSEVAVRYTLRDNSNGEVKVSRFLIKGLSFESSTAFELASQAKFLMKDHSTVSFDTIVIGEFNIADLIKNGSVSSTVIVKVSNISKTGLEWKFPEITTNLDLLLKKGGELSGKITTSFESQNKISANFKMTKSVEITDINADVILKDVSAIMGTEKTIDMSKAKLKASGSLIYTEDKKINANLNFFVAPGIVYSKEGMTASTIVNGEFKGKDLFVKIKSEAMEGQVNTTIAGVIDPGEKFDMTKLKPFDIRILASGMKLPEKFIRAKLWDKKTEDVQAAEDKKKTEAVKNPPSSIASAPPVVLPPSNIIIDWNNISIGGEDFSGHGKIVTSAAAIAIDNMTFKFSKGTGKLSQTMNLNKLTNDSKFNFEVSNLNLNSFKAFFPPFIENFSGTFTGKVNGTASMFKTNRPPVFDVNVVADAKNGEIKKLNISDYINPLLANIPVVKDKVKDKQVKIDGNFETLTMKGRFTSSQYTISTFDFVGINKKVQISGSGEIYPHGGSKQSTMEVNFVDNTGKISDVLQQNVGTKVLPIRVAGNGFDLKPDYGYTVSKLAKGAIKTRGQEEMKKIIDKNLDKIVPGAAKEKVKGLLDGFFKKK